MKTIFVVSINIVLYIVYAVLISLMFSFAFPQILELLGKPLLEVNDPFFDKVQIVIMISVLLITAVLRKYFYVSLENEPEEIKQSAVKESIKSQKQEYKKITEQ